MTPFSEISPINIIRIAETDSTNRYLAILCAEQQPPELTTILADYQTSGRGQRGNSWEAERGKNLLFSTVLRPSFLEAKKQFLISQIISLSIKEELDNYGEGFSIKWPNDIYWHEKKICGMLIENDLIGNYISQSISGIGININQDRFYSTAPNPVSLKQITEKSQEPELILRSVLNRIAKYYVELRAGETTEITKRYHRSLFRRDGMHPYIDSSGQFTAELIGVAPEGNLILRDENGTERRYAFKEVSCLFKDF